LKKVLNQLSRTFGLALIMEKQPEDIKKVVNLLKERISELEVLNHELVVAKDKAETDNQLKTAFIQSLSHEIRTPLNAVLGFSNLMTDETLTVEEKQRIISLLRISSNKLSNTIDDYINISRIVSGKMEINKDQISVTNLMLELLDRYKPVCDAKSLNMKFDYPNNPYLTIFSDPTLLRSIFYHLLDNALNFTISGSIALNVTEEPNHILWKLTYTGKKMEEKNQENIFDDLLKQNESATLMYEEIGLGLSIVKGFLDLLGGQMQIISESGVRTTIVLSLPK
jgi:signal transduction histidine kinase